MDGVIWQMMVVIAGLAMHDHRREARESEQVVIGDPCENAFDN
jgi:hypothetical protein